MGKAMSETVDPRTGEILDRTTVTATGSLAELLDASSFRASLRELDARIAQADREIDVLKENLKVSRRHRESLVAELRAAARGDRALPFDDGSPRTTPASDSKEGPA
jgi:hypothetical protein